MFSLLDFVSPPICPCCKRELCMSSGRLCQNCEEQLPLLPKERCPGCGGPNPGYLALCNDCIEIQGGRPWQRAASALPFSGIARKLVHLYKFRTCLALAPFFAERMFEAWNAYCGDCNIDAITYIPLHFTRYLTRGYNQSEILADMLSRKLGMPKYKALKRLRRTSQQARLGFKARAANMAGAFEANSTCVEGKRILLVDDVFTTGATFGAATRTLQKAGAAEVYVLSAARA